MFPRGSGRLTGRTCLVVGGTAGIGLASSLRFLREGARVAVTGLEPRETPEVVDRLRECGPAWGVSADVSDPEAIESACAEALAWLGGRLDVLLHVAGLSGRRMGDGPLHECTIGAWDGVLDANARGPFVTNRWAVRAMLGQGLDEAGLRGTIVNVGSVLATSPAPGLFGTHAYAASKGALRAMTLAAAARYAPDRIRFNLLAPGLIETPMSARAVGDPVIRSYLATKQPIASGPGTADDCAEAALYLCEPASRFVTGVELVVDGGWSISEGQVAVDPPALSPEPSTHDDPAA